MDDDILIEILVRLPVKSLFRCKIVCKAWDALISGDHLRRKLPLITSAIVHHCEDNLNVERRSYACDGGGGGGGGLVESDLSFFPSHQNMTIVDCCNGLILCRQTRSSASLHVLSPITRRWATLPNQPRGNQLQLSVLGFDPWRSPEFKVVCFSRLLQRGAQLDVFSSETMSWAEHTVHWGLNSNALSTTMRYFDGALHILAYPNFVVCMDLSGMNCNRIELPEPVKKEWMIGKSRGHLHYAHVYCDQLRIWMLEEGSNELRWRLDHTISIQRVYSSLSLSIPLNRFKFLGFHPESEVVYLWLQGKLVAFDLSKKSLVVHALGEEGETAYLVQIWVFPFTCHATNCLLVQE